MDRFRDGARAVVAVAGLAVVASSACGQAVVTDSASLVTQEDVVFGGVMYVNLATGERTVTRAADLEGVDLGALDLFGSRGCVSSDTNGDGVHDFTEFLNINGGNCGIGPLYAVQDDPDRDGDGFGDILGRPAPTGPEDRPLTGEIRTFAADIAANTVVDRFSIAFTTNAVDPGGSGIVGMDMRFIFSDADNGIFPPGDDEAVAVLDLTLTTLPGASTDPSPSFTVFFISADFSDRCGGTQNPTFVFELGDDDGADGAGVLGSFNPFGYRDFDKDGLHDFSYSLQFDQSALPPSERSALGYIVTSPLIDTTGTPDPSAPDPDNPPELILFAGNSFEPGYERLTFDPDDLATGDASQGTGVQDGYVVRAGGVYGPPLIDTTTEFGSFDFGGMDCAQGIPGASMYMELYGPQFNGGCEDTANSCFPDYNGDCVLDFNDVISYLTAFKAGDPAADIIPGGLDFNDFVFFLNIFVAGCP